MRIRKITALLLLAALCLCAVPGLAAPCRDVRALEAEADEGLCALTETLFFAEIGPDWTRMMTGVAASQGTASREAFFARALACALLRTAPTTQVSLSEAAALMPQLFTGLDWVPTESTELLKITQNAVEVLSDVLDPDWRLGVHIYEIRREDGGAVTVKADLYGCPAEYRGGAEELPEAGVTWLMHGAFSLRPDAASVFGWTADDCAFSPLYRDGRTEDWQEAENAEAEYSVSLPGSLLPAEDPDTAGAWRSENGDTEITVTVTARNGQSFTAAYEAFAQAHPDWAVDADPDLDCFWGMGPGRFELCVLSEYLPGVYRLTFLFPEDRQEEAALYAEFIRNSFIVWGLSNG